ncbi:hypothetical protein D3C86_1389390 [compost metagenome]
MQELRRISLEAFVTLLIHGQFHQGDDDHLEGFFQTQLNVFLERIQYRAWTLTDLLSQRSERNATLPLSVFQNGADWQAETFRADGDRFR